jgi:hypothetical protein
MAAKKGNKYAVGNEGGRPTEYSPETLVIARDYANGGWERLGHVVPSLAGLSVVLKVSKDTLLNWSKDEGKKEFFGVYRQISSTQEFQLINGGLKGEYNSAIAKMLLAKHGYSDKPEVEQEKEEAPQIFINFVQADK